METKQAKTFEDCQKEIAKNWKGKFNHGLEFNKAVANLFNSETAAERDRLKAKSDLLLKWQASAELEISSLKEENERLKALEKKAINLLTDRELEVHSLEQLNSELVDVLQEMDNAFTVAPSSWLMTKEVLDASLKLRKLLMISIANQQKEKP